LPEPSALRTTIPTPRLRLIVTILSAPPVQAQGDSLSQFAAIHQEPLLTAAPAKETKPANNLTEQATNAAKRSLFIGQASVT
jgi:hypothetical protein